MTSFSPHCALCDWPVLAESNDFFRCERCSGLTGRDGEPYVPTECGRCHSHDIVWTGLYYDCRTCGRVRYGPYPRTRGFYRQEPEDGYAHWAPGVIKGVDPAKAAV